jgi:hypothetical protein
VFIYAIKKQQAIGADTCATITPLHCQVRPGLCWNSLGAVKHQEVISQTVVFCQ